MNDEGWTCRHVGNWLGLQTNARKAHTSMMEPAFISCNFHFGNKPAANDFTFYLLLQHSFWLHVQKGRVCFISNSMILRWRLHVFKEGHWIKGGEGGNTNQVIHIRKYRTFGMLHCNIRAYGKKGIWIPESKPEPEYYNR